MRDSSAELIRCRYVRHRVTPRVPALCQAITLGSRASIGSQIPQPHLEDGSVYRQNRPTFSEPTFAEAESGGGTEETGFGSPVTNLLTHPRRPVVNLREGSAHERGTL